MKIKLFIFILLQFNLWSMDVYQIRPLLTEEAVNSLHEIAVGYSQHSEICRNEHKSSIPFMFDITSTNKVDLYKYYNVDEKENPIAKGWAGMLLMLLNEKPFVPKFENYRTLAWSQQIIGVLKKSDMKLKASSVFYTLLNEIDHQSFTNQPFISNSCYSVGIEIFNTIPQLVISHTNENKNQAKRFIKNTLLLDNDFGRWFWDLNFRNHMKNVYKINPFKLSDDEIMPPPTWEYIVEVYSDTDLARELIYPTVCNIFYHFNNIHTSYLSGVTSTIDITQVNLIRSFILGLDNRTSFEGNVGPFIDEISSYSTSNGNAEHDLVESYWKFKYYFYLLNNILLDSKIITEEDKLYVVALRELLLTRELP